MLPEAKRLSSTAATVSQLRSGDPARDQQAVVAQALHQRADDVDAGARQFGQCRHRLLVFPLLGKTHQRGFVELAVLGEQRHVALGGGEIARAGHFAVGAVAAAAIAVRICSNR